MEKLDQIFMAKSKLKTEYIEELINITRLQAEKLTVKQLKQLIAKHEPIQR